jgi:hypothetical protein
MKNFTTALQTLNNTLALGETHITLYIEEEGVQIEQVTVEIEALLRDLQNTEKGETHRVNDFVNLYIIEEDGDYLYSNSSMSNVFFNKTEAIDFCTNIVFEDYFEEHDVECNWEVCKKEVIANSNITV